MKLLHFFQLLLLVTSTLFISCTKEPREDPRFSCKINGELWNPKDGNYSFGLTANYDYDPSIGRDVFSINAAQHDHPSYKEIVLIFNKPIIGKNRPKYKSSFSLLANNLDDYFIDTLKQFSFLLTSFDTSNRTAKGEFDGYLYNRDDSSAYRLHITEGKFNVKF